MPLNGHDYPPVRAVPARCTVTVTSVATTGADQTVIAANPLRTRLIVVNHAPSGDPLRINFGAAVAGNASITVYFGQNYDSGAGPVPIDALHAMGPAGVPAPTYYEF